MHVLTMFGINKYDYLQHFVTESTQTVQALQHPTTESPLSSTKEVEIRSLKTEIEILKKQIAG